MSSLTIRAAAVTDAAAINRIYNHYIVRTVTTFDIEAWSIQRREALARRICVPYNNAKHFSCGNRAELFKHFG